MSKINLSDQSRIERIEREYEETLRKELNILEKDEFWNLESSEQWQYISYLESRIKEYSKNVIVEVKKQSLQDYTLQNLKIPKFLTETEYWEHEKENQWSYVNNTLVEKYWNLRIELRNLIMRPSFNKLLGVISEMTENWSEFRKSIDKDRRFYKKLLENGYEIKFRKMF